MMLSALLDHLWQSTLMALAIGLLVLALRKAPAAVRHGLWLAASIKFLIPFAALAALGRLLAPAGLVPAAAAPQAALIEKAAEPLARFPFAPSSPLLQSPFSPAEAGPSVVQALHEPAVHFDLVLILLIVWAAGCGAVLVRWSVRSARITRIVHAARPIAWRAPMPVKASPSLMEPGLVGLLRPVLIVPETLPERLRRSEIDAILAHEACHLRRCDNLTAGLHALIEAVFWFHPLVWWIGTRLIVERENACDEAVLRAGHDRRAYARSLVETARFYLQSPPSCVPGASGGDLKTRVEKIMTAPLASPLSRSRKAFLLATASFTLAAPVAAGLLTPEAQKVVAPLARAVAAISRPAHVFDIEKGVPERGQTEADKPVALARNDVVPAPVAAVAASDAGSPVAPPALSTPDVGQASWQTAPPVEAAATLAQPTVNEERPATLVPVADEVPSPEAIERRSRAYVQNLATAPNPEVGQIGRWHYPVCVQVEGLARAAQAEVIKARIESVSRAVGLPAAPSGCKANVEIVFSNDPQATMDGVAKRREDLLGYYHRRDHDRLKTVSRPIQAWYKTSTRGEAANDERDPDNPWSARTDDPSVAAPTGCGDAPHFTACLTSQFENVLIVVDNRALQGKTLGLVADYAVMLALSQPKSLDGCVVLPSILDLTARSACAGRDPPDGLTPADAAWLTALYESDPEAKGDGERSDITGRMARMLIKASSTAR